ncbi:MAG: M4 family metallopeptidase [Chitinophagaceae bacterium]
MKFFVTKTRGGHSLKKCLFLVFFVTATSTLLAQQPMQQVRLESEAKLRADKNVASYNYNDELQTPQLIILKQGAKIQQQQAADLIKSFFGVNAPGDQIMFENETTTPSGITVSKYRQYYNGLKLQQGSYSVVIKNGEIQSIAGESYPTVVTGLATNVVLTERQALQKCLDFTKADVYGWEALQMDINTTTNVGLKLRLISELQKILPLGVLVYCKDVYGDKQAHLAYQFDIYTQKPIGKYVIYIDAVTGKVLLRDAVIKHADEINERIKNNPFYKNAYTGFKSTGIASEVPVPIKSNIINTPMLNTATNLSSVIGTGKTRYAGTRQIFTQKIIAPANDPNNPMVPLQYSGVDPRSPVLSGDVYVLSDDTRGKGVATYDLNGAGGAPVSLPGIYATGLAFVDKDNNWKDEAVGSNTNEDLMRGATQPPNAGGDANESMNDDAAIDAHWGAEIVYDYWKAIHGRKSYDNADATINSFIHYGVAYDNAFWNGSVMTYGDGQAFRPLVSLDVCGHEIAHGVCFFTSDLVYAGESGGMNEGLSDIWASCIEHYALTTVDNTLPYQVWQVGEQIDVANIGLRRQDNPKAKTDPDTYNGRYWTTTVGCTPTLANDQCGVHNNSGVLNKWFYLLVQGPKTTTGIPAYTDDGIADAGTTVALENLGNNYGILAPTALGGTNEFLPLGFADAEKITYLMELTMPSSSTFADARTFSIQAATTLFGPCSQQVITTTDAWFAVGVGAKWGGCTAPLLDVFTTAPSSIKEFSPGGCGRYTDYVINANLNLAQLTPVTISFATSGTATLNKDFSLSGSSLTFNAGETGIKTIILRVFDDAVVEGNETIDLVATSSAPSFSKTFNFTIADNDIIPVIGSSAINLLNENFESTASGSLPAGWAVLNQITPTPVNWVVRTAPAVSAIAFTTKRLIIELPLLTGQALYDQNVSAATLVKTNLINANGLNTINVQFTASGGGEPACSPACDYGSLKYSFDGINFSPFTNDIGPIIFLQTTDSVYNFTLPPSFNNKQFYLGFQWINDANGGSSNSVTIDNVNVTAKGRQVESDLNNNVQETLNAEGNNPVYLYSSADGQIMASLTNISADLGCVTTSIKQAGGGMITYSQGQRSEKVFEITPTTNSTTANYTVTLYFKTGELAAWGAMKANLKMLKSNASNIDGSDLNNSVIATPFFSDFPAEGYSTYTANFTGFSKFALVSPTTILPISFVDFSVVPQQNSLYLNWVTTGTGTVVANYIIERRLSGMGNFKEIGKVNATTFSFTDAAIEQNTVYEYRIRQTDASNNSIYSPIRTGTINGKFKIDFSIAPNPVKQGKMVKVVFNQSITDMQLQITSVNGANLLAKQLTPGSGTTYELNTAMLPAGVYYLKAIGKNGVLVKKVVIQ